MKRNLKALGLALVAAFAMSAVAAASASAVSQDHFTSNKAVTHLTAEALTPQEFRAETGGADNIFCSEINVHGTIEGTEVTEVTVKPTYNKEQLTCKAKKGGSEFNAVATTNGCHYKFTGETTSTVTPGEHATVHLECPAEKSIETEVTALKLKCLSTGTQTLEGARYEDVGEEALRVDTTIHGIKTTTAGACGSGEHTDGQYTGSFTLKGYADAAHTETADLGLKKT